MLSCFVSSENYQLIHILRYVPRTQHRCGLLVPSPVLQGSNFVNHSTNHFNKSFAFRRYSAKLSLLMSVNAVSLFPI